MLKHIYRAALGLTLLTSFNTLVMADASTDPAVIKRGQYLSTAGDCEACHRTAKDPLKAPFSGGYVIESPMGSIVASNITPSRQYGIGNYSEAQFASAVRDGVRADGANLYPAMPYTSYRGLTDSDVHALYSYFMHGVEPVDKPAPQTELAFPFNMRWLMKGWNLMFLKDQPAYAENDKKDRGRYLVDALGHCSSCHTPRNLMMAESSSQYLAGGSVGGWYAPNITSDAVSGIGAWSEDQLVQYLRAGHVDGKGQAAGGMAEAIEHSLRHLPDEDLHEIAAYLKAVPAIRDEGQSVQRSALAGDAKQSSTTLEPLRNEAPNALADASSTNGEQLYMGACASCHQPDGKGTLADGATKAQFYPALNFNSATGDQRADNLVMAILKGVHRETNDYLVSMPAFEDQLNSAQVAAVSNFVMERFGNPQVKVTAAHVDELRAGGPAPLLMKAMPYLIGLGVFAALVVLGLLAWFVAFRRKR